MKRILFFVCLLLLSKNILSQDLPNIVPPSPNAASLAKYVEVPVSHYTGLPSINIPLYNVSSGDIQVPVGLSYHARGIKVEEIASNYGLGWSLNAGGVITRQIRGRADDQAKGYLGQNYYDTFFTNPTTRRNAYVADINSNFDRDPDLFMFNFLGFSGKFIYDRDTNTPILQTFDDIDIETVGNPSSKIEGFIVTDSNGIKYYFGKSKDTFTEARDKDHTEINYTYVHTNPITATDATPSGKFTSWYLLDIVTPLGKEVNFTYGFESGFIESGFRDYSITHRKSQEVAELIPTENSGNRFIKTAHFSKVRIYQQKLKKIKFDGGEVNFNYDIIREDLDNSTALSSLEVKNDQNQRVKKYVFDYIHTEDTSTRNIINHLVENEPKASKRLFLNSITQEGNNNHFLPPHKFTYNSTILPNRFSTSYDLWGYYNGKNNGPFATFTDNADEIAGTAIDTLKSQAGLLTKIEYPTGGWSEYEYESNKAKLRDEFKDLIAFGNSNPTKRFTESMDKDSIYYNTQDKTYSIPFTVGPNLIISYPDGSGKLLYGVDIDSPFCTDVENSDCPYLFRIYNEDDTVYGILHATQNISSIKPGNYILKVISNDPDNEDPLDYENNSFGIVIDWQESVVNELDIIYTGGNRVKKVILNNGIGDTIVKIYEYKKLTGETSGKVFALPSYYEYSTMTITGGQQVKKLHAMVGRPANTLTYEQGNHGGYSFVTEYYGDQNNNHGKTEYEFTTDYNSGLYYKTPYYLPTDNEWLRGKPLEIRNFKKNNDGSYDLISKTKNTYEYGGVTGSNYHLLYPEYADDGILISNSRTQNFVKLAAWATIYDPNWSYEDGHNLYTPYYLNAGSLKLKKTEAINYYNSYLVNNTTEYYYNYDKHYQTKYTKSINSKGKTNYSEIIYPQDKLGLTTAEQKLKDTLHQFVPLEINTYEGLVSDLSGATPSSIISRLINNYEIWENNLILPSIIQTSKGANSLENRIIYHKYDDKGNPLEVSKADGTHIVYLWGYNKTQPIAKIENATYLEVENTLLQLQNPITIAALELASGQDNDRGVDSIDVNGVILPNGNEGLLRQLLNRIREALPNSQVSTYTYDPLIGVTSITDPRGEVIYYHYDAFNRLEYVKDSNGNILNKNEYHYKGQQ